MPVGFSAECSSQYLSCHIPAHEGTKEATSSNMLDPALETASPSVTAVCLYTVCTAIFQSMHE